MLLVVISTGVRHVLLVRLSPSARSDANLPIAKRYRVRIVSDRFKLFCELGWESQDLNVPSSDVGGMQIIRIDYGCHAGLLSGIATGRSSSAPEKFGNTLFGWPPGVAGEAKFCRALLKARNMSDEVFGDVTCIDTIPLQVWWRAPLRRQDRMSAFN
jgi:hypothetical protein